MLQRSEECRRRSKPKVELRRAVLKSFKGGRITAAGFVYLDGKPVCKPIHYEPMWHGSPGRTRFKKRNYINSTWIGWSSKNALVVCKMLGFDYGRAMTDSRTRYWLSKSGNGTFRETEFGRSKVNCKGDEKDIKDCDHQKDNGECKQNEPAGIECFKFGKTNKNTLKVRRPTSSCVNYFNEKQSCFFI